MYIMKWNLITEIVLILAKMNIYKIVGKFTNSCLDLYDLGDDSHLSFLRNITFASIAIIN